MKRVLSVQDICCLGKCSLTVSLPIISAMGVEAAILPTALLSTHTMFKNFTVKDLTDQFMAVAEHWKSENIEFDTICTGYLGSQEEIAMAEKLFDLFRTENTRIIVDPVMADNGKLYPAFDEAYAARNTELCKKADIILPNITEACLMTGTDYKERYDEAYIHGLLERLGKLGGGTVILTGVSLSPGKTGVAGYDVASGQIFSYQNDRIDAAYHGTGDIFASVITGALTRGLALPDAIKMAADYTAETIRVTVENPARPWYGVDFETTLPMLTDLCRQAFADGK